MSKVNLRIIERCTTESEIATIMADNPDMGYPRYVISQHKTEYPVQEYFVCVKAIANDIVGSGSAFQINANNETARADEAEAFTARDNNASGLFVIRYNSDGSIDTFTDSGWIHEKLNAYQSHRAPEGFGTQPRRNRVVPLSSTFATMGQRAENDVPQTHGDIIRDKQNIVMPDRQA